MRKPVKRPIELIGSKGQKLLFSRKTLHEQAAKLGISKRTIDSRLRTGWTALDHVLHKGRLADRKSRIIAPQQPKTLREHIRKYAKEHNKTLKEMADALGYTLGHFVQNKMNNNSASKYQSKMTQADIATFVRMFKLTGKEAKNLWIMAAREAGWRV